jgi:hypothetical protein
LADSAKYDASCASSGVARPGVPGGLGNSDGTGISHSYMPDGRCAFAAEDSAYEFLHLRLPVLRQRRRYFEMLVQDLVLAAQTVQASGKTASITSQAFGDERA